MEIRISYSALNDLLECGHRYKLKFIDKKPQSIDNRRLLVANVIDKSLSDWVNEKFKEDYLVDKAVTRYDEFCKTHWVPWKGSKDKAELRQVVINTATVLEESMRANDLCTDDATTQTSFKWKIDNVLLTGRPDVYYPERGMILDCKTTKEKKWLREKQLILYAIIATKQFNREHTKIGFLAPQMSNPVQIREITQEDKLNLIKALEKAVGMIETGNYPFTNNEAEHCFMCYMKHACVKNKPILIQKDAKGKMLL